MAASSQSTDISGEAQKRVADIQAEPCRMLLPIEGYEGFPELSLEMAVESLENTVPKVSRNAWIAKERTADKPADGLTQEESAAIHLYTMEWQPSNKSLYALLNAALRAEDRGLLISYFPYLKLVLTAMWKLPSVKGTVWRGIKADLSKQYPEGKNIVWWGFSSCTDSLKLLESDMFLGKTGVRTLFSIECDSGKAIYAHSYFPDENEILLLPATQFLVKSNMSPASGLHIIHLKEITPRFPLLQSPFAATTDSSSPTNAATGTNAEQFEKLTVEKQTSTYRNKELEKRIQEIRLEKKATFNGEISNNEDMRLVIDELRINSHWKHFDLIKNKIDDRGMTYLLEGLQTNSSVWGLSLNNNSLGDSQMLLLSRFLKSNSTLTNFHFGDDPSTDIGAKGIADILRVNANLRYLSLACKLLSEVGLITIVRALHNNRSLIDVTLSGMPITNMVVKEIVSLLQVNTNLECLALIGNSIVDSGMQMLCVALQKNKKIIDFRVSYNRISDESIDAIITMLQHNRTIQTFDLKGNQLSEHGKETIRQAVTNNNVCKVLKLEPE